MDVCFQLLLDVTQALSSAFSAESLDLNLDPRIRMCCAHSTLSHGPLYSTSSKISNRPSTAWHTT